MVIGGAPKQTNISVTGMDFFFTDKTCYRQKIKLKFYKISQKSREWCYFSRNSCCAEPPLQACGGTVLRGTVVESRWAFI